MLHYRRRRSIRGVFRPNGVLAAAPLNRVTGPSNVQPHVAWYGSRGVAVVAK
jgi:hypothetical protein